MSEPSSEIDANVLKKESKPSSNIKCILSKNDWEKFLKVINSSNQQVVAAVTDYGEQKSDKRASARENSPTEHINVHLFVENYNEMKKRNCLNAMFTPPCRLNRLTAFCDKLRSRHGDNMKCEHGVKMRVEQPDKKCKHKKCKFPWKCQAGDDKCACDDQSPLTKIKNYCLKFKKDDNIGVEDTALKRSPRGSTLKDREALHDDIYGPHLLENRMNRSVSISPSDPSLRPRGPLVVNKVSPTSVKLIWGNPSQEGVVKIKEYIVEKNDIEERKWVIVDRVPANRELMEAIVGGLDPGKKYLFSVAALTALGVTKPLVTESPINIGESDNGALEMEEKTPRRKSALRTSVREPEKTPSSPSDISSDPSKQNILIALQNSPTSALLTWDKSAKPVKKYVVAKKSIGKKDWDIVGYVPGKVVNPLFIVSGLKPGRSYNFRVDTEGVLPPLVTDKPFTLTEDIKFICPCNHGEEHCKCDGRDLPDTPCACDTSDEGTLPQRASVSTPESDEVSTPESDEAEQKAQEKPEKKTRRESEKKTRRESEKQKRRESVSTPESDEVSTPESDKAEQKAQEKAEKKTRRESEKQKRRASEVKQLRESATQTQVDTETQTHKEPEIKPPRESGREPEAKKQREKMGKPKKEKKAKPEKTKQDKVVGAKQDKVVGVWPPNKEKELNVVRVSDIEPSEPEIYPPRESARMSRREPGREPEAKKRKEKKKKPGKEKKSKPEKAKQDEVVGVRPPNEEKEMNVGRVSESEPSEPETSSEPISTRRASRREPGKGKKVAIVTRYKPMKPVEEKKTKPGTKAAKVKPAKERKSITPSERTSMVYGVWPPKRDKDLKVVVVDEKPERGLDLYERNTKSAYKLQNAGRNKPRQTYANYPIFVTHNPGLVNDEKINKQGKIASLVHNMKPRPKKSVDRRSENLLTIEQVEKNHNNYRKRSSQISGLAKMHKSSGNNGRLKRRYSFKHYEIVDQKTSELRLIAKNIDIKECAKLAIMSDSEISSCDDDDLMPEPSFIKINDQHLTNSEKSVIGTPVIILLPPKERNSNRRQSMIFQGRMLKSTADGQKVIELNPSAENRFIQNGHQTQIYTMLMDIPSMMQQQTTTKSCLNGFMTKKSQATASDTLDSASLCKHAIQNCIVCDLKNQITMLGENACDKNSQDANLENISTASLDMDEQKETNDITFQINNNTEVSEEFKQTIVQQMKVVWEECLKRSKDSIINTVVDELEQKK